MTRSMKATRLLCGSASLIAVLSYAQAYAQTSAPPAPASHQASRSGHIEEIVVTAQKRSQKLQRVPIAVAAFSAKDIAQSGITNATSLGHYVAALTIAEGGGGTVLPFLRGVGNPDSINGNESSVAVYLDDVYVSRLDPSYLELSDISRVEVLKGPQGTLFGRNASAGVINIITKEPDTTFHADASVTYANYDKSTEKLYVTGPIAPGIAANLSILNGWQGEGWGRNLTNHQPIGYVDPLLIRSKWVFHLSSSTTLRLEGDYNQSYTDIGGYVNNVPGTTSGSPVYLSQPPFSQTPVQYKNAAGFYDSVSAGSFDAHKRNFGLTARLDQDVGFGQLSSITGYRQNAEDFYTDGEYAPQPSLEYQLSSHTRTFTQELQLASKAGSPFDWIAGLFYLNEFASYEPTQVTGPALAVDTFGGAFGTTLPPESNFNIFAHERTKDYAAYTQVTVHLPFATNLTGGFRYTVDDIGGGGYETADFPGVFTGTFPGALSSAVEFRKPTFKIGLDHRFAEDILAYASFSRGFKSGTYNLLPFSAPATLPEVLDSYELGLKTTLLEHRLQLNGAFFYYDYTDPQVQEVVNHLIFLANAKAASVTGVEAEGQYVVTPDLTAHFGAEYLEAHYTDFPNAPFYTPNPNPPFGTLVTSGDAAGNQLPYAPKFAFRAGINYDFDSDIGNFNFNSNYAFSGSFRFTPDNILRQKAYGLLDASLTYMLPNNDRWSLRAWGRNITGVKYSLGQQENAGNEGYVYAPAAPAEYGGTLEYKF